MNELKMLIEKLLAEIDKKESNLNVAGGRGYSAGKVYPNNTVGVLKMLGPEEGEEKEEYVFEPIKISKAFKKEKKWVQISNQECYIPKHQQQ